MLRALRAGAEDIAEPQMRKFIAIWQGWNTGEEGPDPLADSSSSSDSGSSDDGQFQPVAKKARTPAAPAHDYLGLCELRLATFQQQAVGCRLATLGPQAALKDLTERLKSERDLQEWKVRAFAWSHLAACSKSMGGGAGGRAALVSFRRRGFGQTGRRAFA